MPWETKFDIDNAIDKAIAVFWAKGYKSTSLTDLLEAMSINKGSFYNTFGSKKALFAQALEKYDREHRHQLLTDLRNLNNPVLAINQLFNISIKDSLKDPDRKGCFIINTALDLPNHDKDTEVTVKRGLKQVELFFQEQIELGISQGEIPAKKDSADTAKSLLTLAAGWRVLSRGIFDEPDLNVIKKQVSALIS